VRLKALGSALLLGWATLANAQEQKPQEPPKPQFKFEFHGFVGGTTYVQDGNLFPSEGQQSLAANLRKPTTDRLVYGADVRQSRFNFSVTGPNVFGTAVPKGVLEFDFFGGFGSGAFGNASLVSRLRLAYAELAITKNHRVQFGQNNDLMFAMAPTSLAHIAFPFGYLSGNVGWRRPGIWGFHNFPVGTSKVELAWEVARPTWADAGGIGNQTVTASAGGAAGGDALGFSSGGASGLPATEARLTFSSGPQLTLFVTGHWHRVDRNGVDAVDAPGSKLDVIAGNAGGKAVLGPVTLAATGYYGKNLAPLVGTLLQFQPNAAGDINEWGAWAQAGVNFTKELSLWGYVGRASPDADDMRAAFGTAAVRMENTTLASLLQWRSGGFAIGAEWVRFITDFNVPAAAADRSHGTGNQYLLTGLYFF
jgi:hypothetical protein